jgi:membrane protein involved in colicin uptake
MGRQLNEQFKKSGKIKIKMSNGKFYPITGERLSQLEAEGKLTPVLADAVLEIPKALAKARKEKVEAAAKEKADAEKQAEADAKKQVAKEKADAKKQAEAEAEKAAKK